MSLGEVLGVIPKSWRPTVIIAFLVGLVVIGTVTATAKAGSYVDARAEATIGPVRKDVADLQKAHKYDHAMMRHIFIDHESERGARGQPRHTLKDIEKESEIDDDDLGH